MYLPFLFQRPDLNRWIDGVDALAYALVMERTLNQELLTLVGMANTAQDPHVGTLLRERERERERKREREREKKRERERDPFRFNISLLSRCRSLGVS